MTDRRRLSAITHGDRPFHNPLEPQVVDGLLGRLGLRPADRLVDVGCGPGELLIRAAERFGCAGTGIDLDSASVEEARRRAAARVPGADLDFRVQDAGTADLPAGCHAVAACLGSTHALGGLSATVDRLHRLARPGGYVLVGDGYWRRPPDPGYLAALGGATRDELTDLAGLVRAGEAAGLLPVGLHTVDEAAWDRYEWTLIHNGERFALDHPADPSAADVRRHVAAARERCLMPGGRETLGFALVLWLRP